MSYLFWGGLSSYNRPQAAVGPAVARTHPPLRQWARTDHCRARRKAWCLTNGVGCNGLMMDNIGE